MPPTQRWIVTLDKRTSRLVRCVAVPGNRWRADEVAVFRNAWEDYHEHERPEGLSRGGAGGSGYHFSSPGHESEEMLRRYARDAARWLGAMVDEHEIDDGDLFAPPRLLGELRKALAGAAASRLREHEGDLNSVRTGELPSHAAVATLLRQPRGRPTS